QDEHEAGRLYSEATAGEQWRPEEAHQARQAQGLGAHSPYMKQHSARSTLGRLSHTHTTLPLATMQHTDTQATRATFTRWCAPLILDILLLVIALILFPFHL